MNKLIVKFTKYNPIVKSPQQNNGNCYDLFAYLIEEKYKDFEERKGDGRYELYDVSESEHIFTEIDTGISVEIPMGYVGLLFPRSSISNTNHILANSVGVIDDSYRGTIKFRFRKITNTQENYDYNDRIGQIMIIPVPEIEFEEVTELSETTRGSGGFGSTGR